MTIQEQIDAFYRFALDALKTQSFTTVEEVLDHWRMEHPTPEADAEDSPLRLAGATYPSLACHSSAT